MVETRKTEVRFTTSDPKEMLNKYLVKDVHKTWEEDFLDEDTGTVVQIDRNSLLFTRGTVITQDVLAGIRFHMDAGDIKEVEVSNQQRVAFELKNTSLLSYMAQVVVGDKKIKLLLHATSVQSAIDILKDYIELNFKHAFEVIMVKKFDVSIILVDTLKKFDKDDAAIAYMKDEIDGMEYSRKIALDEESDASQSDDKKFYQIDTKVLAGEMEYDQSFIVNTFNVDRGMMIINEWLKKKEEEQERRSIEAGHVYEKRDLQATIEQVKAIPVSSFIPQEFSMAYMD